MNRHTADRVAAIGEELIRIHTSLRQDLASLRDSMAAAADSDALPIRGLSAHCMAFCSAVTVHHTGEDSSAFPDWRPSSPNWPASWTRSPTTTC